jgi:alpha-tubulin suppressor-like RCC1 family protein
MDEWMMNGWMHASMNGWMNGSPDAWCVQTEGGAVLALGRSEYGRLGLGEEGAADAKTAAVVGGVAGCIEVACGTAVSYAVTGEGKLYRYSAANTAAPTGRSPAGAWAPTASWAPGRRTTSGNLSS